MKDYKISAEEKKWRAQEDARILAQSKEIMADKNRLKLAQAQASKKANELQKEANRLKSIAKKGKNNNGKTN